MFIDESTVFIDERRYIEPKHTLSLIYQTGQVASEKLAKMKFTTGSGANWDTDKPIRTSMPISNPKLTGKFEDHPFPFDPLSPTRTRQDVESMVEVDHDFGTDYIWEQFVSQ